MADVKISALPSASTPLAGTEVLPIVQSATTDQVSVANLTAGRSVSAASLTLTTTPLAVGSGGTGLDTLATGRIPYGAGTSAFSSSSSLYFDGTNLGIGTSSPSSYGKLAVYGASGGISARIITGGGTISDYAQQILVAGSSANYNINMLVYGDGSGAYHYSSVPFNFGTSSSNPLIFLTNSAERMRLDASGNLGLGATSPQQLFHMRKDQNGTTAALIQNRNGTGSPVSAIQFISGAFDIADNRYAMISSDGGSNTTLKFWTGQGATPTQAMTLDASGNLGIGSGATSPSARLDVNSGSSGLYLSLDSSNANGGYIRFLNSGTAIGDIGSGAQVVSGGGASNFGITSRSGNLILGSSSTERARIDSSGNLLVGTTSWSASTNGISVQPSGRILLTNNSDYNLECYGTTSNKISFHSSAGGTTRVGSITTSTTATTYNTSSDISLKENIVGADIALSSILALPVRQFDWKNTDEHTDYGVVAQEAYDYAPEIVTQGDLWSVDYGRITPRLIKAFQELAAKVEVLEAKVA